MRKFTILALLAFGLIGIPEANCQTPTIVDKSDLSIISVSNSKDDKGFFCFSKYKNGKPDGSSDNEIQFSIYNENFSLVKSFSLPLGDTYDNATQLVDINDDGIKSYTFISRGIFNNEFSYILPSIGNVGNYSNLITGFKVFNPEGVEITSIILPEGYYQNNYVNQIQYVSLNGTKYILVGGCSRLNDTSYNTEYTVVYNLDTLSRATQIALLENIHISPRTPRKGETVTVSLNDEGQSEGCVVNVVASDGRTLIQKNIPAGENTFTFNTAGFPQGLYIVTTSAKEGKAEAAKIIVH
ncbi:MAG: T9SS type A sorting domain-containing protein [Muribaculaceae bacterium]|nr:T9SS type A sorting domain-containing protein [Muribaculaceae bacterium]